LSKTAATLERLELRIERLRLVFRFTYAFHAREVRFECDRGDGFHRIFPETFSFHPDRHDPAEIYLQLDDLATKPQLLAPAARRRDVEVMVARFLLAAPRYIEGVLDRLESEGRLDDAGLARVYADVALLAQVLLRFANDRVADGDRQGVRLAILHLRKILFRAFRCLVERRVSPDYLAAFVAGEVDAVDPADDLSETGFFHTIESGSQDAVDRTVLRLAERAFYRWVEDVCLDDDNAAFEAEDSPFDDREIELRRAIHAEDGLHLERGRDLAPFLRRPGNKDCLRLLSRLQGWFLRRYDVHHAAAVIHHADAMSSRTDDADRVLSRHGTRNYLVGLSALALPFLLAALFYDRAPGFFDALCAAETALMYFAAGWFLFYRFLVKRDLTFFHAAVPRIAAGIIVGYLPIFFIDEVWGLANLGWVTLTLTVVLLGSATFLYLYVEVAGRLEDAQVAFSRARQIFLLGLLQATGVGLLITGLVGRFMALRNWSGGEMADITSLRGQLTPFVGELPRIVGMEPFFVFPAAVFVMAFMSYFIGTFLQLMWEDIPMTEPL
jgi:hypothetical protein